MIYKDDTSSIEINIEYFREDLTKKKSNIFFKRKCFVQYKDEMSSDFLVCT